MKKKIKINFTDFWFQKSHRRHNSKENLKKDYIFRILSQRFDLDITDNPDFLLYSCFGYEFLKYNCVRIICIGENIRPNFNECDYAFSFDFPITEKNFRLPLYRTYDEFEQLKKDRRNINKIVKEKTKFCNFLYSNKRAKERIEFFNKLRQYKKIDSGGKVLNNLGYFVGDKISFLKQYKFTIAFENSSYPGYTTEKIVHAFAADTIPIYWGNPNVGKDFNTKAFINCHDYKSFDEVIERVKEVDNNDELYKEYLEQPFFPDGEENESVKEENILDKFETIFSNKDIKTVARKTDILKYYFLVYRKRFRKKRRETLRKLRKILN